MSNGQDYSTQGIIDRMQAALAPTFRQGAQAVRQAAGGAARRRGTFGAYLSEVHDARVSVTAYCVCSLPEGGSRRSLHT